AATAGDWTFASEPLFWNTNASILAQSAGRQSGLPFGTAPEEASFWASAVSSAQVRGAFLIPALANMDLLISTASGGQSFGKPEEVFPTLNALSRPGESVVVSYLVLLMNAWSGCTSPCCNHVGAMLEST